MAEAECKALTVPDELRPLHSHQNDVPIPLLHVGMAEQKGCLSTALLSR